MRVHLESTTMTVEINGSRCRIWEGTPDSGIPVHAMIALIGTRSDAHQGEFQRDLKECKSPSAETLACALWLVL